MVALAVVTLATGIEYTVRYIQVRHRPLAAGSMRGFSYITAYIRQCPPTIWSLCTCEKKIPHA